MVLLPEPSSLTPTARLKRSPNGSAACVFNACLLMRAFNFQLQVLIVHVGVVRLALEMSFARFAH